jgi:hypothetical protein
MRTLHSQVTKTPQNQTITPAHLGQEWPFCIQNLRIWPKTKHFSCRPPSIQVSFLVAFFETAFFTHSPMHTLNFSSVMSALNPNFVLAPKYLWSPIPCLNTFKIRAKKDTQSANPQFRVSSRVSSTRHLSFFHRHCSNLKTKRGRASYALRIITLCYLCNHSTSVLLFP